MNFNLRDYNIISFDIFDTLLLRTVARPIDVFDILWRNIQKYNLCSIELSPSEFTKIRIDFEHRARLKTISGEVTLFDIYKEFPDYIIKDKERVQELELETEISVCYLNYALYSILQQYKHDGKIIVLLSDMYFSKKQIIPLLKACMVDLSLIDAILVSSEYACSKQSGTLYDVLLSLYPNVEPNHIVHIGDNQFSDYKQALRKGLHAIHYQAIPNKTNSIYDYERIRHNTPLPELLSLRKISCYSLDSCSNVAFEIGASILGPVLSLYISHVCDRLEKLGLYRIFPFMREGKLLEILLKSEAKWRGYPLQVKTLFVSRKVSYIPSISVINREEIENLIGARNLTIQEAFSLLGIHLDSFEKLFFYKDVRFKEAHTIFVNKGYSLKEYVIDTFLIPENKKIAEDYIKKQRQLFIAYLRQEIEDFKKIATIDIGFFGRIPMWIEQCLELEGIPKEMTHFLAIGITGDKIPQGYHFEGYFSAITENGDLVASIHRSTDILEKLISASEGSTIGYTDKDGRVIPILSKKVNTQEVIEDVFRGIQCFQSYWHKFSSLKPDAAKACKQKRRELLMLFHRLIDMPRPCEAELIGNLEADTNFGTQYKKQIITKRDKELLENKGVDYIDKCNISYTYDNNNIVWPKGVITLKFPYFYVQKALHSSCSNETIQAMQTVVERISQKGISQIALYGAGENGRQFYFLCSMYQIKVLYFIDRKESLWGTYKEGIEVIGLKEAMSKGITQYLITSLFSISEIQDYIQKTFEKAGKIPEIFTV